VNTSPAPSPTNAYSRYTSPWRNFRLSGIWWSISSTVVTAKRTRKPK